MAILLSFQQTTSLSRDQHSTKKYKFVNRSIMCVEVLISLYIYTHHKICHQSPQARDELVIIIFYSFYFNTIVHGSNLCV